MPLATAVVRSEESAARARESEQMRALDATIDRLRTALPEQPYIQTIPQDEPRYHHYSQDVAAMWLHNTPFHHREDPNLQYQTWNYHEHGSDLIYLQVHSDTHARRHDTPAVKEQRNSSANTPLVGAKKKISLATYKDKKANTPLGEAKHAVLEVAPAPRSSNLANVGAPRIDGPQVQTEEKEMSSRAIDLKRKRDTMQSAPSKSPRLTKPEHTPPRVKQGGRPSLAPLPRPTSPREPHSIKPEPVNNLPDRLSPLHFPLPDRLSPYLPTSILAALDERDKKRDMERAKLAKSNSVVHSEKPTDRSDSKRNYTSSPGGESKERPTKRPSAEQLKLEQNGIHEHAMSDREDPDPNGQAQAVEIPPPSDASVAKKPIQDVEQPATLANSSLIIKLKIPKRLRQDASRLLRFAPHPANTTQPETRQSSPELPSDRRASMQSRKGGKAWHQVDEHAKGVAKRVPASAKRARPSERGDLDPLSPEIERTTASSPVLNPKTPLQPPFQSPPASHRPPQITPSTRKDFRSSAAMKRVESSDSVVITPPAAVATPASSSSAGHSSQLAIPRPSPAAATHSKTPESQTWWAERERLMHQGKTLKRTSSAHAALAQTHGESTSAATTPAGRRELELAALTALESFAAFMLGFHCHERSYALRAPPILATDARNTWCSLHGFWKYVAHATAPWPALHGLAQALGAVYCARIMGWIATAAGQKVCEADALATGGELVRDAVGMMSRMADAPAAGAALSLNVLKDEFPRTWKVGVDGVEGTRMESEGGGLSDPTRLDGGFEVPIALHTTPLHAVRIAASMLGEWRVREGGAYAVTLVLDSSAIAAVKAD